MRSELPTVSRGADIGHIGSGGKPCCARWPRRAEGRRNPARSQKNEAPRHVLGSALGLHFFNSIHPFSTCRPKPPHIQSSRSDPLSRIGVCAHWLIDNRPWQWGEFFSYRCRAKQCTTCTCLLGLGSAFVRNVRQLQRWLQCSVKEQ